MNPLCLGGSIFMNNVFELSRKYDIKIDIEIGPNCKKNFIKLYRKIRNDDGELRTKNKKIEISEKGLQSYDIMKLTQEVMIFIATE